jgi:hypothetical protein
MMQQQAQQNPQQGQAMMAQIEQLMRPVELHDIKVSVTRTRGQVYIDPVPPEEFRVNSQHNSINLDKARFTAHVVLKTASDVMREYGLSKKEVDELDSGTNNLGRDYRFREQNDSSYHETTDTGDDANRLIEVSECYLQIDMDETGIASLWKVDVAGGDNVTHVLKTEQIDCMPWVATTAFLMSHKFMGRSVTDRLKEIQNQKTSLLRNILDNVNLQNNQRNLVLEGQVNLDDLLISRPGGIVRTRRMDAVQPMANPPLGQEAYQMMEYLDKIRAGRTGVDAEGPATPQNVGDRVGSQGVDRLMNAKEELVGLIIRVIAETGVKPLCMKIRDLCTRHVDSVVDFRFRGQWQKIQPSAWPDRTRCTVRVGTGTGNTALQAQALQGVLAIQEKLAASPHAMTLLSPSKIYTAVDDLCKFSNLNGAHRYFIDPNSPEGQQAAQSAAQAQQQQSQQEQQQQLAMLEAQVKVAEAEMIKAKADADTVQLKAQVEGTKAQMEHQKNEYEAQLASMEIRIKELTQLANDAKAEGELQYKYDKMHTDAALKLTEIEAQSNTDQDENHQQNKAIANG